MLTASMPNGARARSTDCATTAHLLVRSHLRRVNEEVAEPLLRWKQADERRLANHDLRLQHAVTQRSDEAQDQWRAAANVDRQVVADRGVQHVLQRRRIGDRRAPLRLRNADRAAAMGSCVHRRSTGCVPANEKRFASMKPCSGAINVGLAGRYRFRQLASSPGLMRKRMKRTSAELRSRVQLQIFPSAWLVRVVDDRHFRASDQRKPAGPGFRIVRQLATAATECVNGDDDERSGRDQGSDQHASDGPERGAAEPEPARWPRHRDPSRLSRCGIAARRRRTSGSRRAAARRRRRTSPPEATATRMRRRRGSPPSRADR